jgi:hypothetical protein
MTTKTICEVCKKVVEYTNPAQQVQEAIDNPDQFCEGHIAAPSKSAVKSIMRILRADRNPNNRFFIAKESGELLSSAYLNRADGSYFPSIPKGSYEIGAGKKQSGSYACLESHLHDEYIEAAKMEEGQ